MKRKHEYEEEIQALKNRLIGDDCAVMRLERRVEQLEAAIKDAPHTRYCNSSRYMTPQGATIHTGGEDNCDCWKSKVLRDE